MNNSNGTLGFDYSTRERSYSWCHGSRPAAYGANVILRESSDECLFQAKGDTKRPAVTKKRRKSYTEMIATAIMSSPEKRLTLAEIYDWMAANVEEYKDQRYVPSSCSWKNAVRHNLSVQSCFKRVKRHGVEKPSWWTVDMRQVAKRRLSIQPTSGKNVEMDVKVQGLRNGSELSARHIEAAATEGTDRQFAMVEDLDDSCSYGKHAYSRNVQLVAETDGPLNRIDSPLQMKQSTAILDSRSLTVDISPDAMIQAWINHYETPETGASEKDGQTLRVKTVHGVERNVSLAGPLRLNVVLRCDKSAQTEAGTSTVLDKRMISNGNASYILPPLSRFCSIDSHGDQSLMNLGNDATCDLSKICSNDVQISGLNVLSPTAVFEDGGFHGSWNSNSVTADDIMNISSTL